MLSQYGSFSGISIHALLAESDHIPRSAAPWQAISIHALLAESDSSKIIMLVLGLEFLSTLSLRRATGGKIQDPGQVLISIHALLAESDIKPIFSKIDTRNFYPRSPCGERQADFRWLCWYSKFLSTLSLRRATALIRYLVNTYHHFYPRSPCGERRCYRLRHSASHRHFYPRSPCGERLIIREYVSKT